MLDIIDRDVWWISDFRDNSLQFFYDKAEWEKAILSISKFETYNDMLFLGNFCYINWKGRVNV